MSFVIYATKSIEYYLSIFHLSDRKFLFLGAQHVYELETFTRVCFPIQDLPCPDLDKYAIEVVRENQGNLIIRTSN